MKRRGKGWSRSVDNKLRFHMENTAHHAFENGRALRRDAIVLGSAGSHGRAMALAILAEEEFAKAFVLMTSAVQGRWDSTLFEALRHHGTKQGIAQAMLKLHEWVVQNQRWNPSFTSLSPLPADVLSAAVAEASATMKKPYKDYLKQTGFYVSLDEYAQTISKPTVFDANDIRPHMEEVEKFERVVGLLFTEAVVVSLEARRFGGPL